MTGRILNGTYRLIELIGSGGMAEVYRAVQLTPPQRTVAVKILKSEFSTDAAFLRRFAQEAEAVLVLSHDNIVRSFDVGEDDGTHYIVLEHVEGETLKERIRAQGHLTTKQTVNLGAQVLDALGHAHEAGIIHRDVKPQNIIVTARHKAKLADFGIARQTASDQTQTFMGSSVLGSVHYLSPEQAKGEQVTVRSDIYSMGITLYEMATGRLPFEGETSVSVAIKHLSEPITPPIAHNQAMPPALNDVICKALNKNPQKRYPSARAMRQDLLRVLREPNGTFARPEVPSAQRRSRRRSKSAGILRITLAAFVLIGLFVVLLLTGQNRPGSDAAGADLVPTLSGKNVEEAREIASRRGYQLEVIETMVSDQYDSGIIMTQYPLAGTSLKGGNIIQVTVSSGSIPQMDTPDFTGLTLQEVELTLQEQGLRLGAVLYELNDAPVGTVFRQDPVPEAPILPRDEVDLFISGEPSRTIAAPEVSKLNLAEALSLLQQSGFSQFRVYLAPPELNDQEPDTVVQQNPAPGEPFLSTGRFTLTLAGSALYAAPLSFKLDVPEDDSSLVAVLVREESGIPYELVVYETTLREGEQDVSFTTAANDGGEFQLLLYLNGTQVRQTNVILSYRG